MGWSNTNALSVTVWCHVGVTVIVSHYTPFINQVLGKAFAACCFHKRCVVQPYSTWVDSVISPLKHEQVQNLNPTMHTRFM